MKKEVRIFIVDVIEPDGEYQFPFANLDDLLKFANFCNLVNFEISHFDTDFVELDS